MSRKVGQIIARGERRWLVRVYLGRDRETRKRTYHNRTIYGSLRYAQAHLTRRLHERDLSRGVEGLQCTVDEFLDHWLKTAVEPKVRGKTYSDYATMLRRYIRPAIGTRILASLSPLEIQSAYQIMIDRKLSALFATRMPFCGLQSGKRYVGSWSSQTQRREFSFPAHSAEKCRCSRPSRLDHFSGLQSIPPKGTSLPWRSPPECARASISRFAGEISTGIVEP